MLQTLQTSRLLPPGLIDSDDLVDGRLDKLCCMTALLCLFQALRPTITQEMVEGVEVTSDPSLTTKSSPARHLPDLPSNLPPAGWTNVLEEVNCLHSRKCILAAIFPNAIMSRNMYLFAKVFHISINLIFIVHRHHGGCALQVLSWLLEAEDHLLSLHSLGQKQLETVSINNIQCVNHAKD